MVYSGGNMSLKRFIESLTMSVMKHNKQTPITKTKEQTMHLNKPDNPPYQKAIKYQEYNRSAL